MPRPLNLNTATKEELIKELNLRADIAERIVRMRAGKPFKNIEELLEVEGVGPSAIERIKGRGNIAFDVANSPTEEKEKGEGGEEPLDGAVTGSVSVDDEGKPSGTLTVDLGKLFRELSRSSKERDFKKIAAAIKQLARFTTAIVDKLIDGLPEGKEKEKIRRKAAKLKEQLEELEDAIRSGDEDAAEEAAEEVEDTLEDLQELLEEAGIDLPLPE